MVVQACYATVLCLYGHVKTDLLNKCVVLIKRVKGQKKATVSCHTPNRVYTK